MKTTATLTACLMAATLLATTSAHAWNRNSQFNGARGASRPRPAAAVRTAPAAAPSSADGPYGYSASKSSASSCNPATGSCRRSVTATGPYGQSVNRNTTWSR